MSARPMLGRLLFTLCAVLFWMAGASQARPSHTGSGCHYGKGKVARNIRTVKLSITPAVDKDAPNDPICHLIVQDLAGNVFLSEDDISFEILSDSKDINGDGIPDLVLEAYSGGAHCCWTYYIVSLGSPPGLITKFENKRAASFVIDEKSGATEIVTLDGAFDYFDGLCHACTPFPLVYLRLRGTNLTDVGPQHTADYDEGIRDNELALTPLELHRLRTTTESPSIGELASSTTGKVLAIVFAYLYSGRTDQARESLQKMWPPFDQQRIWNLILEKRHNGILCYTIKGASCGID